MTEPTVPAGPAGPSPDPARAGRKDEHVRLAAGQQAALAAGAGPRNDFDEVELLHHALDGVDPAHVDLTAAVGPWRWPLPLYVNGMTGGSVATGRVNRAIGIAARATGIPVATGSVSAGLDDAAARATFTVVRDENPDGFVMANLGADRTPDDAVRAVEMLRADALQVHLNAAQETVMPEGSRRFETWAGNVAAICAASPVPVVVKEVGAGLSGRTLARLAGLGVTVADVGGRGGTDFVGIENDRRPTRDLAYLRGWGQSAVACLLDAPAGAPHLLASGGVRTPLDVVRALALGARAAGVAGRFLRVVLDAGEPPRDAAATDRAAARLVEEIEVWRSHLAALHGLLGARTPAELMTTDVLVRGTVREFAALRGIDVGALTRRTIARPAPDLSPDLTARHDGAPHA
jgi:isopentenyl-diphosphate delta-isomerase